MKLIVGLGNPGKKYENTRHNVGWLVLDKIISDFRLQISDLNKKNINAEIFALEIKKQKIILAKPLTFMNESGQAISALVNFYKINPTDLIVVHDDKDLPLGEIRVQTNRGPAGHNGIKSIIEKLGTQNFTRVRVGVAGEMLEKMETADFVLAKFTSEEKKVLEKVLAEAVKKIVDLIK
ncbi:MAG: aminoacyl-tRNA hydrolase [Candidatus Magasanikbacteria bacterium RIFOXYD2_FULL_41_14]|uniref:Peptidyl-tRNA hydrolase n=1 Tax=Candidatus Magasanikbacteria bacterium RIFOXYD2_FULL_41_14 TaxID=1798709 RepID=A0A1F6PEE4_9BACT|nr:MAG: aminoacyl-tRNA hydrolase [Candidatus Magasanikbacteria bacterium RIFOXYD2_FULL_41_14]